VRVQSEALAFAKELDWAFWVQNEKVRDLLSQIRSVTVESARANGVFDRSITHTISLVFFSLLPCHSSSFFKKNQSKLSLSLIHCIFHSMQLQRETVLARQWCPLSRLPMTQR